VELQTREIDAVGFVRDFNELAALKSFIDTTLDHRHLNDALGHDRTTTEVLAEWLYGWCKARWPETVAVRVGETPQSWAEYRP
jgi:6-pyruvoyltetrahydropterin/6-carboxytetrahydropterin synthase